MTELLRRTISMNMDWKEQIRAKLEPQILGLIKETEQQITERAARWGVAPADIVVTIGDADPCVQVNLKVQKKYK